MSWSTTELQQEKRLSNSLIPMPVIAAISLGTLPYLMYIGLPIIVGAISDQHQLSEQQVGWVASADLAGLFVGSIVTSLMMSKIGLRQFAVAGILIAVTGNGISILGDTAVLIAAARFVADFGGGVCHALGLACLARVTSSTKNFSLYMVSVVVVGSVWLFVLPFVAGNWGDDGIFAIMLIVYAIPAILLGHIENKEPAPPKSLAGDVSKSQQKDKRDSSYPTITAWAILAGVLMFYVGATAFWTFAERLGVSIGLGAKFMSLTFTICNILTLAGCWLAYRLGSRSGPFTPNFAVLLVAVLVFALSLIGLSDWSFVAVIFIFFQVWAMSAIFQLASLSVVDATGRFVALVPASSGLGMSIGPAVSGSLLGNGWSLNNLAGLNAAFMFLTIFAFYFAYVLIKQHRYSHVTT